jgi:hypothetical protein
MVMVKRANPRSAGERLCLQVMQLEFGKQLMSIFEEPQQMPPELSFLLFQVERADRARIGQLRAKMEKPLPGALRG